jgi:hypothetical protein
MEAFRWIAEHWLDLAQSLGIIGGLLFTAQAIRKDETARTVANTMAINEQYTIIWREFYERPDLARILQTDVDLKKKPISNNEALFVKTLLLHLDVVRRTMKAGIFTKIQGLQKDIREFLSLPIPRAVWEKIKPFQDDDFIAFIEKSLNSES